MKQLLAVTLLAVLSGCGFRVGSGDGFVAFETPGYRAVVDKGKVALKQYAAQRKAEETRRAE